MSWEVIEGDCLAVMATLPDCSVDAVICDPPYGTTACKWDSVIPFAPMWEQLKRVAKPRAAILLFGSQPFTSALVMSNPGMFKYGWIWEKNRPSDKFNAKNKPMKMHEDVCVFSTGTTANCSLNRMPYSPQGLMPCSKEVRGTTGQRHHGTRPSHKAVYLLEWTNYPHSILRFPKDDSAAIHPTQKPVALMEYLIRTYTNAGDTVLDFAAGSGTTGVACVTTGRHFIGIEKEAEYCAIARRRIADAAAQPRLAGVA